VKTIFKGFSIYFRRLLSYFNENKHLELSAG